MSVEDPFFVVQKEVNRAVKNCRKLQQYWLNILNEEFTTKHDDYDRISNELKNNIRTIEWDLQDLEETIEIIQSNSHKFNVTEEEINSRKSFINNTQTCIDEIKEQLNNPRNRIKTERFLKQNLLRNDLSSTNHLPPSYPPLHVENETKVNSFCASDHQFQQTFVIAKQDEELNLTSINSEIPNNMSKSISIEMDSQDEMLGDHNGVSVEKNQNYIDFVLKRFSSKFSHFTNERRRWCAIGTLGSSVFVLFLILVI